MKRINQTSIKESVDHLPSGLAIYAEDGRLLLVNYQMNRLSASMMGHAVLNGHELYHTVKEQGMKAEMDGRKYMFHHKFLTLYGEKVHELVADDVTELYEKGEELKKSNQQLVLMAEKMKQYGLTIDETVREQEILDAKMKIHDQMNQLLLFADYGMQLELGSVERKKVLEAWMNIGQMLSLKQESPFQMEQSDMEAFAGLFDLEIIWQGSLGDISREHLPVFHKVTKEAIVNAVKHGEAKQMWIRIKKEAEGLKIVYSNNGRKPVQKVTPSGGLEHLSQALGQMGGSLWTEVGDRFSLHVILPE